MRPFEEAVVSPFEIQHTDSELSEGKDAQKPER